MTHKLNASMSAWTVLTIIFITLKLCGVIEWSWLWVFMPMWFIPALGLVFILLSMFLVKPDGK